MRLALLGMMALLVILMVAGCEPVGVIKWGACVAWAPPRAVDEVDILKACDAR